MSDWMRLSYPTGLLLVNVYNRRGLDLIGLYYSNGVAVRY